MKKIFVLFILIIVLCGCNKKEEVLEEPVISSKGELVCAYKKKNKNENTVYTSYYVYNFNNNGILKDVVDHEEIEFVDSSDEVKEKYEEEIKNIIEEYKDIEGITVKENYDKDKYYFEVNIDVTKIDANIKEDYLLNEDRISLYKFYTNNMYTCE